MKNAPDEFEKQAFGYFTQNPDEKYYFYFPKDNPDYFYFMGLLRVEKGCIHCHKHSKIGDIRGGIRISIPVSAYRAKQKYLAEQSVSLIALISFLVFLTAVLTIYLFKMIERRRKEIQVVNDQLEERVAERTLKISNMHHRETHLRKIMQTIATVNKEIINFHSIDSLLVHVCDILSAYGENKYTWIMIGGRDLTKAKYYFSEGTEVKIRKDLEKFFFKSKSNSLLKENLFANGQNIHEELTADSTLNKKLIESGIGSFAAFPVINSKNKKILGVIFTLAKLERGFAVEEVRMYDELSGDLGFAIDSFNKQKYIAQLKTEKLRNFEETILSLIHLVEERDSYTAGHSIRVAYYCSVIGKEMKLSKKDLQKLEKASILHDLGKIATPDSILLRPGKLSSIEYDLVKLHVKSGYDVLKNVKIYKDLAGIIHYHHERHDGKGYPQGVSGENIPFLSRILSIADAFDAMTTDRVYHVRLNKQQAIEEIKKNSGEQFNPEVARMAVAALEKAEIKKAQHRLPQTELEKKRFAYFFNDRLTELYNEDYFFIIIQDDQKVKLFSSICFLSLRNFSRFNKKFGWDQGDELLKNFSKVLINTFVDSMVFRVQGDDFIILADNDADLVKMQVSKIDFLKKYELSLEVNCMSIPGDQPLEIDKRSLNQLFSP
jgi:HD-GYP domain-containing protein (c-di-GMP phosphodiesterase class II)